MPLPLAANPSGGVVVNGGVEIGDGLGGHLAITQSSHKGIINWEDFSIGIGELTEFRQPGADSATLNRVVSGNPSAIQGALRANGKIFVINPNGIMVGPGGSIDVAGLVLSTLDVSDAEFLAGGDMVFRGNSGAGVRNFGRVNAIGGDVFLIGKTVENAGTLSASGTVGLAAGEEVLITASPDAAGERVFVRPVGGGGQGAGVSNSGTIEGAAVELKAHGNLYALAINNRGSIRATGASRGGGGVYLRAPGGRVDNSGSIAATLPGGNGGRILIEASILNAGGTLDAGATTEQGQGGEVTLSGEEINVTGRISADGGIGGRVTIGGAETVRSKIGDGASISASGAVGEAGTVVVTGAEVVIDAASLAVDGYTGGGEVSVGGGFQGGDAAIANAVNTTVGAAATLSANALGDGDAGRVVIWADGQTDYAGTVTAEARGIGNGGLVEVSGVEGLLVTGFVSTLAANGRNGTLLLDPRNLSIGAGASTASHLNDGTLEGLVVANHVVVSTLDPGTAEAGNISVTGIVRFSSSNSLTLLAEGDIYVAEDIINQSDGNVNLVAGWDSAALPLSALLGGSPAAPGSTTGSVDMDASFFDTAFFGNDGGSVYLGTPDGGVTAADANVVVASRGGQTNVAGHDVFVWGGALTGGIDTGERKYSQIGYNRVVGGTSTALDATGRIRVQAKHDVDLDGNHFAVGGNSYEGWTGANRTGLASFAMIGHGGERDSARDMTLTGEIVVEAGNDITADGGKTRESFAKIGHGGYDNVDPSPTAVVGGNITVNAGGDIRFTGGNGQISFVQLGHGGNSLPLGGYTASDIKVTAGGDVVFRGNDGAIASNGSTAFAQLGHGGYNMDVIGAVAAEQGDILVNAGGKVEFVGGARGNEFALLGHGGSATDGNFTGDVTVNAGGGGILVEGGGGSSAFAMIGHGGVTISGRYTGEVNVSTLGGGVNVRGGTTTGTFANIGSGGYQAIDGTVFTGGTTVDANGGALTDGIALNAGNGNYAHAVIGHGVTRSSGGTAHPRVDLSGAVTVTTEAGGVLVRASTPGYFSHAQIGHGGRDITGEKDGDVTVSADMGDIRVAGGGAFATSRYTHAQIGHGGYGNGITGNSSGDIAVTASAGGVGLTGGDSYGGYTMIGHGGFGAGTSPSGNRHGDVSVVVSGDILVAGGTQSYTFAQIGHGGRDHDGDHGLAGESIRVISETGNMELRGGAGTDSIAIIGHGDNSASSGQRQGDILVDAAGEISLVRNPNIGWIGHRTATATAGAMADADVTIRASSTDAETGVSGSGIFRISGDLDAAASRNLLGGDVSLIDLGDGGIWVDEEIRAVTGHTLNLLSFSDIFVGDDLINPGTGDINLVAGWAPGFNDLADLSAATELAPFRGYLVGDVDMAGAIFDNPGSYGAGGGSVHVGLDAGGAGAGAGVMVGSRYGATRVAGYDVNVWAAALATDSPYSHAQIGYNRQDSVEGAVPVPPSAPFEISGSIRVGAVNDVSLISNLFAVGADGYPGWGNSPTPGAGNEGYAAFARIGHGARDLNRGSLLSGDIVIDAGNDVSVNGGRSRENYAMIGHGGFDNKRAGTDIDNAGIGPAKISVDALGNVVLNAGSGSVAYAQIGHVGATHDLSSFTENAINVSAGGDVTLRGGTGGGTASYSSYAMIGHGGDNSDFVGSPVGFAGDIAVNAGGAMAMEAGDRNVNFVQIGHGGNASEGNHRGKIEVIADGGAGVTLRSGSSSNASAYAQIGHGGTGANGSHGGEICVVATAGGVTLDAYHTASGTGSRGYTQIGHGGYAADGALDGDLTVVARGTAGIQLIGGAGVGRYAQIGHGGEATDGDQTGDLRVVAESGDLSLLGGAGTNAYAMTGHGDAAATSTGQRGGGVHLFAAGAISGAVGAGAGSGVESYHQSGGGLTAGDYLGGDGFEMIAGEGVSLPDSALIDVQTMIDGNLASGPISLAIGNVIDLTIGAGNDFLVDTADDFYLLTGGSLTLLSSYQNLGDGDVFLVAGWDGSGSFAPGAVAYPDLGGGMFNYCEPTLSTGQLTLDFNDCDAFGAGGATVTLGDAARTGPTFVGSRGGSTYVAGAGVALNAGASAGAATQLGFHATAAGQGATGDIRVGVKSGGLSVLSGVGEGAYTQIGHGGGGSFDGLGHTGGVTVEFCENGDLTLMAGGEESYAQIGHGGSGVSGNHSGALKVGGHEAAVSINTLTVRGGASVAYAQIGHGGRDSSGALGGDLVVAANVIDLDGGTGTAAYSQIGHGGYQGNAIADGAISGNLHLNYDPLVGVATGGGGDITLNAGAGTDRYAQIGHGGLARINDIEGLIKIGKAENLGVTAGGLTAYAMIGHGGEDAAGQVSSADIEIDIVGDIDLNGGAGGQAHAQIGHGGHDSDGLSVADADIILNAAAASGTGDITLDAGTGSNAYAQIGHGGTDSGVGSPARSGDVRILGAANVRLGQTGNGGSDAYSQIGHGGDDSSGDSTGEIEIVSAGVITLNGGASSDSYSQIGHGGHDANGAHTGTIHLAAGGDIVLTGGIGAGAYAMVGHGGADADGVKSGDICVHADGLISLSAGASGAARAFAQIGHGGAEDATVLDGNLSGDLVAVARGAGGIALAGGVGESGYAHIGHGGIGRAGAMTGHVRVIAETGDLSLTGGGGDGAYAMLGHGDGAKTSTGARGGGVHLFAQGDLIGVGGSGAAGDGNVYFFHQNADGLQAVDYLGGDGYQKVINGVISMPAYASVDEGAVINGNIGLGAISIFDRTDTDYTIDGGDTFVDTSDDFYLVTGGGITLLSSYQNEGSGGVTLVAGWDGSGTPTPGSVSFNNGDLCDPVITNPGLSIDFNDCDAFGNRGALVTLGAAGQTNPVMVGSAGGTTTVAAHGLVLNGSDTTSGAFTQLGFRPTAAQGDASGAIRVFLKGSGLTLDGGNTTNAYAQIGHGGFGSVEGGRLDAPIAVTFCEPGDVALEAGLAGNGAYAQIGHGGGYWDGVRLGDIAITGAGNLSLTGGNGLYSSAQIGHGGVAGVGEIDGDITVEAAGDILATGGANTLAFVQIGHGGQNTAAFSGSSLGASAIRVNAGGDVVLRAGTHNYTSAKIGHGGNNMRWNSFGDSPVSVIAGGDLRLLAPQFDVFTARSYSHSQIGHGGYAASVASGASGYRGNVEVEAGGGIDVLASRNAATFNYALIGHTAYYNTPGTHSGDIHVTAGTAEGLADYGLTIHAGTGDYPGVAGTSTSYYNFAAIGHRGHNSATSLTGDIEVDVLRGGVTMIGGTGISGSTSDPTTADIRLHPAQIGHGGYNITSTGVDGSIRVHARDDILLQSDIGRISPVQIGHGGYGVDGTFGKAGDVIEVVSLEGGLELNTTGADAGNTAFIGNGSSSAGTGPRLGDILVDVADEISLVKGVAPVWIGHRGNSIATYSDADVTIRARSMDDLAGDSGNDLFHLTGDVGTMIQHNLAGGHVSLIDTGAGGIWSSVGIVADSAFDLNFLSGADIFMAGDAINRGSGDVNLVAGWDPSVADLSPGDEVAPYRLYFVRDIDMDAEVFDVDGAFANLSGSVWIGANADLGGADTGVAVASRTGQTNVAGHDIHVWGGAVTGGIDAGNRKYSQIGYNVIDAGTGTSSPVSGRIRVRAVNDLSVEANHYAVGTVGYNGWTGMDQTGYASFAQIGHGGERTSVRDMDLTGEIMVEVGNDLSVRAGQTINSHAQIGHGGYDNPDDDDGANLAGLGGKITVDAGGDIRFEAGQGYFAFAQLGHGGGQHFPGEFAESDIDVTAGGDVTFIGGPGNTTGNTNSQQAHAQLGHGGYNADFIETPGTGNNSVPVSPGSGRGYAGDIRVTAGGAVNVLGGGGDDYNFAAIGHGGAAADGDHSGDITVTADGDVIVSGGDTGAAVFATIGHFGYLSGGSFSGNTTVISTDGAVSVAAGDAVTGQAQIGHGGYRVAGDFSGDVAVTAGGTGGVSVLGGGNTYAYAAIGNGGLALNGSVSGSTTVTSTGTAATDGLRVRGGEGNYSSATVGHLSQGYDGVHSVAALDGAVTVNVAAVGVMVAAGTAGYFSHGMIGHGGRDADGDKSGAILVTAESGDIGVEGGGVFASNRYTHAQIGHGGYGNNTPGDNSGAVTVESTTGSVTLSGGESYGAYAQIGHGGLGAGSLINGAMSDAVSVTAGGMVAVGGGSQANAYALIGHGGISVNGALSGDVSVTSGAGGVSVLGGAGAQAFAQIGSGGYNNDNPASGAVTVIGLGTGVDDGVRIAGGEGDYAVGQIGHGGNFGPGDLSGDVSVLVAGGGIQLRAGTEGYFAHAMIGHGGRDNEGDLSGAVAVRADNGDITLTGGGSSDQYRRYTHAQIGHGGYRGTAQTGGYDGDLSVTAVSGNVALQGGDDYGTYSQIGHGGLSLGAGRLGEISGEVAVTAGGSLGVALTGGSDENAFALIGHGGHLGNGDMSGDVDVLATGTGAVVIDGGGGPGAFAQIGHGGSGGSGDSRSEVSVSTVTGDITLRGGAGADAQARIGLGGAGVGGTKSGAVTINTGGTLELFGGDGIGASAQVGHGGAGSSGLKSGEILVNAARANLTAGNSGAGAHTQIGHGGLGARFGATGFVTVILDGGGLTLDAGDAENSFALIGHGGADIPTAPFAGSVQVVATSGGVALNGGNGGGAFAQIGNGGHEVNGSKTGSVLLIAGQSVSLTAGDGDGAIAQVGMGGFNSPGNTLGGDGTEVRVLSGGDLTLRASDVAEGGIAMIGNGGRNSDSVTASGNVVVMAEGDIDLTAGAAEWAAAQIGNGGVASDGNFIGDLLVSAERDLRITRGGGDNAYAKIGHGDWQYTPSPAPNLSVGTGDTLGGDIQVTAGQHISLSGGMIGHLDPALNQQGVGGGGDTLIAVSRDDPTATGTGVLSGDAESVLASDPTGELRLYLPGRAANQLAGTHLNGVGYPGANIDPMNQQIDEFVIHQIDADGVAVLTPAEHQNLENAELNLLAGAVTTDTANYRSDLGNYSLYYDTITVIDAGPPLVPGGAGGPGGAGAGGGGEPVTETVPEIPADEGEPGTGSVFTVTGPDGAPFQLSFAPGEVPGLFLRMADGSMFYVVGRMGTAPLFFPVGDLLEDSLDDFLNTEAPEFLIENRSPWDPWGDSGQPDFEIVYQSLPRPGFGSFDLFGPGGIPFIDIVPMGVDDPAAAGDDLRRLIERLQIELEELDILGGLSGLLSAE